MKLVRTGSRAPRRSRSPPLVGARAPLRRLLHGHPRRGDRDRRPALDPGGSRLLGAGAAVGGERLCAHLRRPAPARRTGGRPARAPARVHGRHRFSSRSPRCSAGSPGRAAALIGSPRVAGRRRGDHDPDGAVDHHDAPSPEGPERNKALGIWGMLGGFGATAAWLIGGPLVDGPGWEWIFFINIPLGLGRARAVARAPAREPRRRWRRRSYDPAGALTITGALSCSSTRSSRRPTSAGQIRQTILLFAGSAAAARRLRADRVAPPARRSCRCASSARARSWAPTS